MEKGPDYIFDPEKDKNRLVSQYLRQEVQADLQSFTDDQQPLLAKFLNFESLLSAENTLLQNFLAKWWNQTHKIAYGMKMARDNYLIQKYTPAEPQSRLIEAVKSQDQPAIAEIKKIFEANFPDQLEGVMTLFGLLEKLEVDDDLSSQEFSKNQIREKYKSLTEYQFLLSHFVYVNRDNKPFLETFWQVLDKLAKASGQIDSILQLRCGVLSQIAVYRIMENLGYKPSFAHPKEDAFNAIDLWVDNQTAVQIKGGKKAHFAEGSHLIIEETDTVTFPAVEMAGDSPDKVTLLNTDLSRMYQRFATKVRDYGKHIHKEIKGIFIVVPYSKIDFTNGEPDQTLIEEAGKILFHRTGV